MAEQLPELPRALTETKDNFNMLRTKMLTTIFSYCSVYDIEVHNLRIFLPCSKRFSRSALRQMTEIKEKNRKTAYGTSLLNVLKKERTDSVYITELLRRFEKKKLLYVNHSNGVDRKALLLCSTYLESTVEMVDNSANYIKKKKV